MRKMQRHKMKVRLKHEINEFELISKEQDRNTINILSQV
jgi:hypothetical protein